MGRRSILLLIAILGAMALGTSVTGATRTEPCDDVFDALERAAAMPHRLSRATTVNPATGEAATSVQEFVPPDRYHLRERDPNTVPFQVSETETIVIGSTMYLRRGDGPWQQASIPAGAMSAAQVSRRDLQNVSCGPPEPADSADERVYGFRTMTGDGTAEGRLWIGIGDGMPHRIEHTSQLADGAESWVGTYDYGTIPAIEPPPELPPSL
jgi:hypothetical protein